MTEFQRNFYQRKLTKPFRIKLFVALSSSWDHFTNAEMAENGPAQKLSSLTLRLMIHPRLLNSGTSDSSQDYGKKNNREKKNLNRTKFQFKKIWLKISIIWN